MAASKRDFKNFLEFPGALNKGTGLYEFPTLKHIDDLKHVRLWKIFVRLVKDGDRQSGIDWNLLQEKQVQIVDRYFLSDDNYTQLPKGTIAQIWVETGVEGGKITRSAPTYFDKVGNDGKSHERNQFQQALVQARSLYLKRVEKGGSKVGTTKKVTKMYFPMLAKPYKDGAKHLKYPLYVQPKLDGVRCITYLKKKNTSYEDVVMYTRTKKIFPNMDYLKKILYPYLNDLYDEKHNQSIYLDGELYSHGKKLQDISGESRNEKKRNSSNLNEYHLYDCFYPQELSTPFKDRLEQLNEIFRAMSDVNSPLSTEEAKKYIKPVQTTLVASEEEATRLFNSLVNKGYEGAILRNVTGKYLADANRTGAFMRSKDLVKMKKRFSDEFRVVGFTEGSKGKDKGAVIWIAETDKGVRFNVTPKDTTYEERYNIYKECLEAFDQKYLDRMLTVEYEDLSKTGVPQRAKALVFRDYE